MQKKFEHKKRKGLPGGPNEMFTYVTGVFDIYQAPSNIEGQGMFAGKSFKKGDLIGLAHRNGQPVSQLGRMHNHDENSPTMISKKSGNDRFVFAAKDLQPGDELTTNYRMQPELEQPEDFQYGGSLPKATISQYEEPAWYEKAADYLASPMTSLGYLVRGEDLPDRIPINAENRNTFDMAFDIINPAAWAAYAESADKNFEEGNYLAAGFDAMAAIPVIPSSVSQGRNVVKMGAKPLPQYVKNVPVGNSDLLMTHAMPGLVPGIKGTKDGVLIAQAAGPGNNHMTLKKFLDATTGQDYYSFTESFINNPMLAGRTFKMAEDLIPKGSILKQAPGGTLSQDSFNLMTRRLGDPRRFRDLTNYDAGYINLNEFAKGRNRLGRDGLTFSQSELDALNAQYMDAFNNLGISEFRGLGSRQVPVLNLGNQGYNMFEMPGLQSIRDPRALQKYYNVSVPNITLQKLYKIGGSLPKAQQGNGETHTVASGETFFGIANKYKLDKQDLIDANPGLNIQNIKAGQTINLPVIEKMEPIAISAADSKREPTSWTDYINPYNWGVTDRDDDGTFNQAFRAARNAGEDEFMWYGTRYNTNLKPTLDELEAEEVSNEVEAVKETEPFNNYTITPELLYKQAFVESTLDPKVENTGGYKGLGQIGDKLIADYKKANNVDFVDPFDAKQNHDVQEWSMNELYNSSFINKPGSTNEVRLIKALASYNWGRGYVKKLLEEQKAKGVDIYTDTAWTSALPKETRDYINMILYNGVTEKRPLVQENFKNALVDSTYKDIRDLYIYKSGGEQNQFQIYKDYVYGVYDGTEMEKPAEKIYDKLNRVYYKEAKQSGTTVPNYILSKVMNQSG